MNQDEIDEETKQIWARMDNERLERMSRQRLAPILPILLIDQNDRLIPISVLDELLTKMDLSAVPEFLGLADSLGYETDGTGTWYNPTEWFKREVPVTEVKRMVARLFIAEDPLGYKRRNDPNLAYLSGIGTVDLSVFLI